MTITNTFKPNATADQAIAAAKVSPRMSKKERAAMLMKAAAAAQKAEAKKPHEAEVAELALVDKATSFIATVFLGTGKYAKREATTLAEARAEGLKLTGVHGKTAMIYAQLPEGLPYKQVLVPDTFLRQDAPAAAAASKEDAMPKKAAKTKKQAKPAAKAAPHRHDEAALSGAAKARRGGLGRHGWREAEAAAKQGEMPPCPDFSAPTHNSYRKKAEIVHALAKERDLKGLQKFDLPRKDSSRTAIMRYRDLCIVALKTAGKAPDARTMNTNGRAPEPT